MSAEDRRHLERAARLAARGHGGAEPNPMVGCVIVDGRGVTVGWGLHRRCGGPHAEREALAMAGGAARGATAYVTLAPCNGTGRTGACTDALVEAGISRVVYAVDDPHAKAAGGVERLRSAGVAVERVPSRSAELVSAPFLKRVRTGRPWVVVKWAQSLDGRVATAGGASQWISGPASRRMVHRERGRVDAVITGIGTVRHDDPRLTAREVRRRRVAVRVVVDPKLELPIASRLVATVAEAPLVVATRASVLAKRDEARAALAERGVAFVALPDSGLEHQPDAALPLRPLLAALAEEHGVATALVEAGPGLVGSLVAQRLVDEAWVFVAPILLGDRAQTCATGFSADELAEAPRYELIDQRRRGGDAVLRFRAPDASAP